MPLLQIGCSRSSFDRLKKFLAENRLNNVVTMSDLAEKILRLTDNGHKTVLADESIGGGDSARWADATKLRSLGWEHTVDLEWGLYETIEWYIDNHISEDDEELQDTSLD